MLINQGGETKHVNQVADEFVVCADIVGFFFFFLRCSYTVGYTNGYHVRAFSSTSILITACNVRSTSHVMLYISLYTVAMWCTPT